MVLPGAFQIGQDLIGKILEMIVFPHEIGEIGGEFIEQRNTLLTGGILEQDIHILPEAGKTTAAQFLCHTAFDQDTLFGQVNAIMLLDIGGQGVEFLISHTNHIRFPSGGGYRFGFHIDLVPLSVRLNRAGDHFGRIFRSRCSGSLYRRSWQ